MRSSPVWWCCLMSLQPQGALAQLSDVLWEGSVGGLSLLYRPSVGGEEELGRGARGLRAASEANLRIHLDAKRSGAKRQKAEASPRGDAAATRASWPICPKGVAELADSTGLFAGRRAGGNGWHEGQSQRAGSPYRTGRLRACSEVVAKWLICSASCCGCRSSGRIWTETWGVSGFDRSRISEITNELGEREGD